MGSGSGSVDRCVRVCEGVHRRRLCSCVEVGCTDGVSVPEGCTPVLTTHRVLSSRVVVREFTSLVSYSGLHVVECVHSTWVSPMVPRRPPFS